MGLPLEDLADNWLRWGLKGYEGLCSHLRNHVEHRRLTPEEKAMIIHLASKLYDTLERDKQLTSDKG